MTRGLDDAEYERILALSHLKRMTYLMKTIAAEGHVWTLARGDDLVVLEEPGSPDAVPIWPHERFARDFAAANPGAGDPRAVPLDDWLETRIPKMREQRQVIAMFPLPDGESGVVNTWEFEEDVRERLAGPLPLP